MAYYGAFYRSALYPVLRCINTYLLRWVMNKYKHRSWKESHPAPERRGCKPAAVLRALGLGETGRQMTRMTRAV
jgi:hypothetical protein